MIKKNQTAGSNLLNKILLTTAGAMIAISCHAQTAATNQPAATASIDKLENHEHKHQLPTEVPIPHRLEPVATQAHPEDAKLQQQRAASLPQK